MSYYVATLNAGDTDRRAYKKAEDIAKKTTSLMQNITEERARDLVKDIAIFETKKQLDTDLQLLLFSHFDKVKDRPSKYIYAVLKWASDHKVPITKQALRGAYKKTFGHQLDYRYVRIVSHFFKLKFFKGNTKEVLEVIDNLHFEQEKGIVLAHHPNGVREKDQQRVDSLLESITDFKDKTEKFRVVNTEEVVDRGAYVDGLVDELSSNSDDWNVATEEASAEPTHELEALVIHQKNTIKKMIDFLQERDLMYEYLVRFGN